MIAKADSHCLHGFSFGAVWNAGGRPRLSSGRQGSTPASGCQKRACSLRFFLESSCLLGNALGPTFASASVTPILRPCDAGSVAEGHVKDEGRLIVMSTGYLIKIDGSPFWQARFPGKSRVEVQRSTRTRDWKQAEAILAGWVLRPIWSASPVFARAGSGGSPPKCRGWSAETLLRWRPTRPLATSSWRGARRWGTRLHQPQECAQELRRLPGPDRLSGRRGHRAGGRDAADGGWLPGLLPRQGPGTRNGQAEAGGPTPALGGDNTRWSTQSQPGDRGAGQAT